MSRTWKWIIGLLAVLLVVGFVAAAALMWQNHMAWWGPRGYAFSAPDSPRTPAAPFDDDWCPRYHVRGWGGHMPMMYGWDGRAPMMYGQGYGPFGFSPLGTGFMILAGLFRLLLPLAVLALVAYLFYQMGKRAGGANVNSGSDSRPLPGRKIARS